MGFDDRIGRKNLKKIKQNNYEELERRKRKALYGTRASSKIFESAAITSRRTWVNGVNKISIDEASKETAKTWKEKLIISSDSKIKAIFDVFVLILVGYSCVTSVFYVAFSPAKSDEVSFKSYFDSMVEYFFILDLFLNFIQSYKHPETYEIITDLKSISKNYVFKGWFFIDFIAVFPFEKLFSSGG